MTVIRITNLPGPWLCLSPRKTKEGFASSLKNKNKDPGNLEHTHTSSLTHTHLYTHVYTPTHTHTLSFSFSFTIFYTTKEQGRAVA